MQLARELAAAFRSLTAFGRRGPCIAPSTAAAALAFYPVVGFVLGLVAAASAALPALVREGASPFAAAAMGLLALALLTAGEPLIALAVAGDALLRPGTRARVGERLRGAPGPLGMVVVLATLGARLWAIARLPEPARAAAFLVAPMLGRWAIVVQCYGGVPAGALVGRARFREFGAASVVAFGATLGFLEAAGLVVLVVAAAVTVGIRIAAHRRAGGLTDRLLGATSEAVETVTFVVLALLARVVVPGAALA